MKTVVSITSYPPRIDMVSRTIQSVLEQKPAPDLIVLYLAESQFPGKKIPTELTNMVKKE